MSCNAEAFAACQRVTFTFARISSYESGLSWCTKPEIVRSDLAYSNANRAVCYSDNAKTAIDLTR